MNINLNQSESWEIGNENTVTAVFFLINFLSQFYTAQLKAVRLKFQFEDLYNNFT